MKTGIRIALLAGSMLSLYFFPLYCSRWMEMIPSICVAFWLILASIVALGLVMTALLGRQNQLSRWTTLVLLAAVSFTGAVIFHAARIRALGSWQHPERGWVELEIGLQAVAVAILSLLTSGILAFTVARPQKRRV